MEAFIAHGLNLAWDFWCALPGHWYYTIGVVAASIPVVTLIVEAVKRLHLKYTATEMTSHFIDFVVLVTGFLMAAADFVITNGNNTQYLPQFLLVVVPTIKALAPTVYSYSKAINNWFVNRKSETQDERIAKTFKLANSFGTAANGVTDEATLPTRSGAAEPAKIQL